MRKIKFIVIALLLTAAASAAAQESEVKVKEARVEKAAGSIDIMRSQETGWIPLNEGDLIKTGDQVVMGYDAELVIDIEGNSVEFTGRTLFSFEELSEDTSIDLWRGRLRSKVKQLGSAELFEIRTPVAVCAVRGTDFEVTSGEKTTLKTYEGRVAFRNRSTGQEVMVGAGMQSIMEEGKAPTEPESIPEPEEESKEETEEAEEEDLEKKTDKSEDEESREVKAEGGSLFNIDGTLGADVLRDPDNPNQQKVYYKLSLMPELSLWKLGLGLDINLYFDEDGNIRDEEWDEWSDALEKIVYVRYGRRTDPCYILAGGIDTYTLGSGIIVSRYSNMLNYPEIRKIGVNTKIDLGKGGFEAFVSDVNEYPLFGSRIFYRPMFFTGLPVLKDWQVGIQGAADFNPDKRDSTDKDEVVFYGADTLIPVLDIPAASADIYGGYATYSLGESYDAGQSGQGISFGVGGSAIKFINYGITYSKVENNFEVGYFSRYYEVNRTTLPYYLKGSKSPVKEGPKFLLGFNFPDLADLSVEYENYNRGAAGRYPYFHGELNLYPPLLLNKYSLGIYYDKQGVDTFEKLTDPAGAIITTEIGYNIAPNVSMFIVQKQTFDEDGEPEKTMSMHTRFSF
ncbi:MAG: FecR family protein [Elusimicrobiota bacterium]|nr:FecR family protein [Elusimicrobiota bacterium]